MSMIMATGAEYNTLLELDSYSGTFIQGSNPAPRSGSYYFGNAMWSYYGNYWLKNFPTNSEIYLQLGFYVTCVGVTVPLIRWRNGTTTLGTIAWVGDGSFKLYTGDSATLVGTTPLLYSPATWYVIELHIKIATSGGILEFRVNGLPMLSYMGNTNPGSLNTINNIYAGPASGGNSQYIYYDDIIINDTNGTANNSWPNGARIILLRPNGAGTTTQLTPSAGANYACMNETPPSLSTYVSGNADGLLDTYALPDVANDGRVIQTIRVDNFPMKVGAPAVNNLKCAIRTGGANYVSPAIAVPTAAMALLSSYWDTNPATGLPWTVADINALEAGVQLAS
jgi:hypothetical protein